MGRRTFPRLVKFGKSFSLLVPLNCGRRRETYVDLGAGGGRGLRNTWVMLWNLPRKMNTGARVEIIRCLENLRTLKAIGALPKPLVELHRLLLSSKMQGKWPWSSYSKRQLDGLARSLCGFLCARSCEKDPKLSMWSERKHRSVENACGQTETGIKKKSVCPEINDQD